MAPIFSKDSGYVEGQGSEFKLPVPENVDEDLATKPSAQGLYRATFDLQTVMDSCPEKSLKLSVNQQNYVNFYAYLQTLADRHITAVLDELDAQNLTDSTLIVRLSDHGDQRMAHGMREKMFQAYDETIHVPLIFSNPRLFSTPLKTYS